MDAHARSNGRTRQRATRGPLPPRSPIRAPITHRHRSTTTKKQRTARDDDDSEIREKARSDDLYKSLMTAVEEGKYAPALLNDIANRCQRVADYCPYDDSCDEVLTPEEISSRSARVVACMLNDGHGRITSPGYEIVELWRH